MITKLRFPLKCLLVCCVFFLLNSTISKGQQVFDMDQTLSDGAQKHQIQFNALGFLSGNFCACTFVPPGKVADYFGFQYTRDNDITFMGHNSDFGGVIGNNVLSILTTEQKAQVVAMAKAQTAKIAQYGLMRFPLIDAFVRMRDSLMPAGSPGLCKDSIKAYSAKLYRLDGEICIERAKLYASIINSFNDAQKHYLDSIKLIGMKNMPVLDAEQKTIQKGLKNNEFVGVMSIVDDIYSWYTGSIEADVYFCPERQGNYFGSFYLKDAPAMNNPGYAIDTSLSQTGGTRFLAALTANQAKYVTHLCDSQRVAMLTLVDRRTDISTLLRGYLSGATVDTASILSLSEQYGELDGEISYLYATNFSKINWTLTNAQLDTLLKIRNLDNYPCTKAYLYSDVIEMPTIMNTDFLFIPGQVTGVNKAEPSKEISLYPNPFYNSIRLENLKGNEIIEITNTLGQLVWIGKNLEKQDFSGLDKGVYFIRINDGKNAVKTFKIIKE